MTIHRDEIALAFAASASASALAGLAFGKPLGRRVGAWLLAALGTLVPWVATDCPAFFRFLLAMSSSLTVLRLLQLAQAPRPLGPIERVWFTLTPFDVRLTKRVPRQVRVDLVLGLVAWLALAFGALWVHEASRPFSGVRGFASRWALGLVGFYASVEAVADFIEQTYLLVGLQPPPLHRLPVASRTVGEFWSLRWNLEVHRILRKLAFLPLARRRRPQSGLAAAFALSTLLHVWIMLPVGGGAMSGLWAAYFLLQGAIVLLERRLGVASWSPVAAHLWTLTLMVGTSPLFVEPMLRVYPG
ncbi:MAG: hypothetical protein HYV07_04270 [Deltaproteobacteria bacterium]|nr:hypothetical protein [Deltaproteobacteria bacterium]